MYTYAGTKVYVATCVTCKVKGSHVGAKLRHFLRINFHAPRGGAMGQACLHANAAVAGAQIDEHVMRPYLSESEQRVDNL